jgi:cellulose synthase (UDP-forming)
VFESLTSLSDQSELIDDKKFLIPAFVVLASVFFFFASLSMDLNSQIILSVVVVLFALMIRRIASPITRMVLIFLSIVLSSRYLYWRITETFNEGMAIDYAFGFGLLVAELYAFIILIFGYIQTIWPLKRLPTPLPVDSSSWPTVDIFIPSYNEPLEVVKPTILAAMAIDWPADKIKVYVLDDGRRADFQEYCKAVGVVHLTRPNNFHAKAGNINAALENTSGEFSIVTTYPHVVFYRWSWVGFRGIQNWR